MYFTKNHIIPINILKIFSMRIRTIIYLLLNLNHHIKIYLIIFMQVITLSSLVNLPQIVELAPWKLYFKLTS